MANQAVKRAQNEEPEILVREIRVKLPQRLAEVLDKRIRERIGQRRLERLAMIEPRPKKLSLLERARAWQRSGICPDEYLNRINHAARFCGSFAGLHREMISCYLEEHPEENPKIGRPVGTTQGFTKAELVNELVLAALRAYFKQT